MTLARRGLDVFGMLDFRAHKLFWLICLPFRAIAKISFYAVVLLAIVIAESTSYSAIAKIAMAYLVMEGIALALSLVVWKGLFWAIKSTFFWLVDVVPSHGANIDEAHAIVLTGRAFELNKKFENEIENWTFDDTREMISHMNWRARLFFPVTKRLAITVSELQRVHAETGKQPRDIGLKGVTEIRKSFRVGKVSWLEKVMVREHFFNSIVAFALILLVIGYAVPLGIFQ